MATYPLIIAALTLVAWLLAITLFERRIQGSVSLQTFTFPGMLALYMAFWWSGESWTATASLAEIHQQFLSVIAVFLTTVWMISLLMKDTSIMDIAYPLTAAVPTMVIVAARGAWTPHELLCVILVCLWSCRLAGHIGMRNLPHGEDARYAAWRRRFGRNWWWWSFFQVFLLQGVLISMWSAPLMLAIDAPQRAAGWQHGLAVGLFVIGFYFQAVSDYQLEHFRKTRSSQGDILDSGLWALSRHPNYFGEALIWWSFGLLGLTHPWGWLGLAAPLYVTWFMSRGSATPMQERYLAKKKPGYDAYIARVPKFFPRLPPR